MENSNRIAIARDKTQGHVQGLNTVTNPGRERHIFEFQWHRGDVVRRPVVSATSNRDGSSTIV